MWLTWEQRVVEVIVNFPEETLIDDIQSVVQCKLNTIDKQSRNQEDYGVGQVGHFGPIQDLAYIHYFGA